MTGYVVETHTVKLPNTPRCYVKYRLRNEKPALWGAGRRHLQIGTELDRKIEAMEWASIEQAEELRQRLAHQVLFGRR